MADFTKIPFGLRESDEQLVDVYDVENGLRCGCICPSCKTPLESRQGQERVWHFAHASRKVYGKTKNECDYSFYLSVRLMARQLIDSQIVLALPEYRGAVCHPEDCSMRQEFVVTPEKDITVENVRVESTFENVAVDVIGTVKSYNFIMYFTHPERAVPDQLFDPVNKNCGIVEIKLDSLFADFANAKELGKSYHDILSSFLSTNLLAKKWIFHPRYKQCEEAAKIEVEKHKPYKAYTENLFLDAPVTKNTSSVKTEFSLAELKAWGEMMKLKQKR